MAFNKEDLYLTSGTGQLINSWTDPVYKFDSSSFYNWEQDNLPIYDLEDRDDFLHEMAGFPASATAPSIMLTVSDCGIDNKKIFGSVSSALEALPNTIRQPVIIEVCVSGQLGDLRLENKEVVASAGGIEIINRGFAKIMCGSGASPSATVTQTDNGPSDGSAIYTLTSVDTSNTMTDTFSVGLSGEPVGSKHATTYTFWNSFGRAFAMVPEVAQSGNRGISVTSKFSDTAGSYLDSTANTFVFTTYADNTVTDDIVIRNLNNSSDIIERTAFSIDDTRAVGFIYNNCFSNVTIKNCSGKVFIRGFCVDGADQADIITTGSQRTSRGFDIVNSDVVIENCTATRCKESGIHIDNSDVVLNRGFLAYHNYELVDDSGHLDSRNADRKTPGMRAVNSNVTLSAALEEKYGLPVDSPFQFTRNVVGIDLTNSILKTPDGYKHSKDTAGNTYVDAEVDGSQTIYLQTSLNTAQGLLAKGSTIHIGSAFSSYQNNIGVELDNSKTSVAIFSIDHNQQQGLKARNSSFNYNVNAEQLTPAVGSYQSDFTLNGQHVNLTNSQFIPTEVSGMYDAYNRLAFNQVFGIDGDFETEGSVNPSVILDSNSYMNAVNSGSILRGSRVDQPRSSGSTYVRPTYGAAFAVKGGSVLDLNGTGLYATNILGPKDLFAQQVCAGICADGGSTINVAGPTSITQYGVDALARNNSTINFQPHMKNGVMDVSGYGLDNPGLTGDNNNHTKVQLHSTRACIVADGNSVINMRDLGDYTTTWGDKYLTATGGNPDYPTSDHAVQGLRYKKSLCTSAGFMQFYANPFVTSGIFNISPQAVYPTVNKGIDLATDVWSDFELDTTLTPTTFSGASMGGMCVRATKNSTVNVLNTKFPCGWLNTSGAYYDLSSTNCELLRIWNIADNSELNAAFLMVSSYHPQDMSANYYGPSAMWTATTDTGLSGAPSSTPDTSTASVLDTFGLGVDTGGELGFYGQTEHQNNGPFRIYVSPAAISKYLGLPMDENGNPYNPPEPPAAFVSMGYDFTDQATLRTGVPYQMFAQGYNASGDCSAINNQGDTYNNPSSIYPELGFSAYIESLPEDQRVENVASSFYYTKDMLPNDSEHRIWLDESAANTFANAKNGLLSTSNRKKIFSVYRSWFFDDELGYGESYYGGRNGLGAGPTDMARGIGSINLFDLGRYL